MDNLNYDFFDEFKKLDKLCKEMYGKDTGNKLGVTLYIEDMEKHDGIGRVKVIGWSDNYRRLKHIRHLRNALAHSNVSFSSNLCTQADLDFVRLFYSKMLDSSDPISALRKQQGYYHASNGASMPAHSTQASRGYRARPVKIRYHSRYAGCFTLILPFILIPILAVLFILLF